MVKKEVTENGIVNVTFEGSTVLGYLSVLDLRNKIEKFFTNKHKIVIDFTGIRRIESEGFRELFELVYDAFEKQSSVKFINVLDEIRDLVETLTLNTES